MCRREANLLWLKDMLDHLATCRQQLEWAQDRESVSVLTETMLRDLDACRRLCESMRRRSLDQAVA